MGSLLSALSLCSGNDIGMGSFLKCKISEKSIVSALPMVGKASTALRTLYERGSCKEDPFGYLH